MIRTSQTSILWLNPWSCRTRRTLGNQPLLVVRTFMQQWRLYFVCRNLNMSNDSDQLAGGSGGDGASMKLVSNRATPKVLKQRKMDSHELGLLLSPEIIKLADAFSRHGAEVRVSGGAIRDVILGLTPIDVDLATNAPPEVVKSIVANTDGITFAKGPKRGQSFGSFKISVNSSRDFDMTSLRLDVKTDGRHAEVEFTTDWSLDAARRDFSCNALFLSMDGNLFDYFDGEDDLKAGRVVFNGDPGQRIREDYLRILRYFRFHAVVAAPYDHEPAVLDAIRHHGFNLSRIPPQRHWLELNKLLSITNPAASINADASSSTTSSSSTPAAAAAFDTIHSLGLLPYLGFPACLSDHDVQRFLSYFRRSHHLLPQPTTLLQGLLRNEADADHVAEQFGLSKADRAALAFLIKHRNQLPDTVYNEKLNMEKERVRTLKKLTRLVSQEEKGKHRGVDVIRSIVECCKLSGDAELLKNMKEWRPSVMPIQRSQLDKLNLSVADQGKAFMMMKKAWERSGKTVTEEDLWKLAFEKTRDKRKEYEKKYKMTEKGK